MELPPEAGEALKVPQAKAHHLASRIDAFEAYLTIQEWIDSRTPASMIRLGDGESAILGFPELTTHEDVCRSWRTWIGDEDFRESDICDLAIQLRSAVLNCDMLGLPRPKQCLKHHLFEKVFAAIDRFGILTDQHIVVDMAMHRLLQFALLYRPLLTGLPFLGIVSSRPIEESLAPLFMIENVACYRIRGEAVFPGPVEERHFPDSFNRLRSAIQVPFRGAVFLVGAGAFGKIYCHWIKERGGIALDVGSLCEPWGGMQTRGLNPAHRLDLYREMPSISARESIERYNDLCDQRKLDTPRASVDSPYFSKLPESW
jgi:hypothetical protein